MPMTQARFTSRSTPTALRAIAWIDECRASLAGMTGDGLTWTCEIDRGWLPEEAFLAEVARVIGDRGQVLILGASPTTSELEHRYAEMYPDVECLVDPGSTDALTASDLVRRLRARSGTPASAGPIRRSVSR
jgi:hypothetical protein